MIDAVLLAGSPNTGPLRQVSAVPYEAVIPIGGQPMFRVVLEALLGAAGLGRVMVVGPPELEPFLEDPRARLVPMRHSLMDNVEAGFEALGMPDAPVLIATSDIPLLTAETVEAFLACCGRMERDVYYPVVTEPVINALHSGIKRTYVRLKDGRFTGGNIALFRPSVFTRCRAKGEEFTLFRKQPLKLARVVGPGILVRFLLGLVSVAEAEKKVTGLLGVSGRAVVMDRAAIAVDVDKPSDYRLVQELMRARRSPA